MNKTLKKTLKITGITLASVIGLVLVGVGIAFYMVFTPKRLTPIVNKVVGEYVTCEHELQEVNLTFFRTFPDFGVSIRGLYVVNPVEGAPSDTVLAIPELVVGVDLNKAINGDIVIRQFKLENVEANLYMDAGGNTNFDVLRLPADTVAKDTASAGWQLRSITLDDDICLTLKQVRLLDERDSLDAALQGVQLCVDEWQRGYRLDMDAQSVSCRMKKTQWADSLHITLSLPVTPTDSTYRHLQFGEVKVAVNEFAVDMTGSVSADEGWTAGAYQCDLNVRTNPWRISSAMTLLPGQYRSFVPKEIEADGTLQLDAALKGRYDSLTMPIADARILLTDAAGHYDKKVLPFEFDAIEADVQAHLDMNEKKNTRAYINRLYVKTGKNHITAKGEATEIFKSGNKIELGNPLCKVAADVKVFLPDMQPFLPQKKSSLKTSVKGDMNGNVKLQCRMNDIVKLNLPRLNMSADLGISGLDVVYQDSILAQSDTMHLHLTLPKNGVKYKENVLTADAEVYGNRLHADLLAQKLNADITRNLTMAASVEWNMKDTTILPTIEMNYSLGALHASMDTLTAQGNRLRGKAKINSTAKNKAPKLSVSLNADTLTTVMGQPVRITTGKISITADAQYNKRSKNNLLLKWNPRLNFDLKNGSADVAAVGLPINIPMIRFNYSNQHFHIDTSRIVLGNSDFSLGGDVKQVGKYLRHEDELLGDLRFISNYTDVNQLMDLVSRLTNDSIDSKEANAVPATQKTASGKSSDDNGPFMVPLRMNVQLLTIIRSADIFDQHLRNLGGMLYVQDGKLILEEMGFICEAAKLQLTAMYRTPRRNHIYAGLDYHMVDIDLQQLIEMVPQIDSLVPMLRSFRGKAQFHIAAETYVDEHYKLKSSTLRGACSIEGKDLVLIDNDTFRKMSKILMFSTKTENKFDSISAQIVAYKDQLTVYPFCVSIDNYMAALGGTHNLDMSFNYHVSLLKPLYIGVDVGGTFDDLSIKPAKCRYAKDFRPIIHRDTETRSAELRQMVSDSLKKNLKISSN